MWNDEEYVPGEEADKDDEPDEVRPNVDRFVVEAEVERHTFTVSFADKLPFMNTVLIYRAEKKRRWRS